MRRLLWRTFIPTDKQRNVMSWIISHLTKNFISQLFKLFFSPFMGFPCGSAGKESACNAGDQSSIPWLGRSPGEGKVPTPVFWPGEFHGLYSPWGCKELDKTEQLSLSLSLFRVCVAQLWNSLPRQAVYIPSLRIITKRTLFLFLKGLTMTSGKAHQWTGWTLALWFVVTVASWFKPWEKIAC